MPDAPETPGPDAGRPGPSAAGAGPGSRWALPAFVGSAVLALAADLITKQVATGYLSGRPPVRMLDGWVYLTHTRNSGAAFSLGSQYTVVFPMITLVVMGWLLWTARRLRSVPWGLALGLVMGGAAGNFTDRLFRAPGPFRGHVVDFISVFDEAGRVFPVFNIADSALCVGVTLAVLLELTGRRRDGTPVTGGWPRTSGDHQS